MSEGQTTARVLDETGSSYFPPPTETAEDGLLVIGGELSVPWLLDAYRHGIFPWPIVEEDRFIAWWSPDPRGILRLDRFHASRRLRRTCRAGRFEVTCNQDFQGVIQGCAMAPDRRGMTWITPGIIRGFTALHEAGFAHSVEVWRDGKLVGGIYGIAIGGFFAGESMFHLMPNASKVAWAFLVQHLRRQGFTWMDIQQVTPHTARMGAEDISRDAYLEDLSQALKGEVEFRPQAFQGTWCPECWEV